MDLDMNERTVFIFKLEYLVLRSTYMTGHSGIVLLYVSRTMYAMTQVIFSSLWLQNTCHSIPVARPMPLNCMHT